MSRPSTPLSDPVTKYRGKGALPKDGLTQCREVNEILRDNLSKSSLGSVLVFTSPLHRTGQTADQLLSGIVDDYVENMIPVSCLSKDITHGNNRTCLNRDTRIGAI